MAEVKFEMGMIGLGVMGRNLVLNMADHGFSVAGFDLDQKKVDELNAAKENRKILAVKTLKEFIDALAFPRKIMLLVPAGPPVDAVINELVPLLQKGDIIIDAGNSYFKDTDVREKKLKEQGISFLEWVFLGVKRGRDMAPASCPEVQKNLIKPCSPF